jgi:hypothetical protein
MAKVDAWMAQREEIARELRRVADQMMSGASPYPWGRKKVATTPAGGGGEVARARKARKRRTMSAEARAKISAAQKARWARQNGGAAAKKAKKGS